MKNLLQIYYTWQNKMGHKKYFIWKYHINYWICYPIRGQNYLLMVNESEYIIFLSDGTIDRGNAINPYKAAENVWWYLYP